MKISIKQVYKSIPAQDVGVLPDVCVITGRNGSGKTHLLEAIGGKGVCEIHIEGVEAPRVLMIPFNGLAPTVDLGANSSQIDEQVTRMLPAIRSYNPSNPDLSYSAYSNSYRSPIWIRRSDFESLIKRLHQRCGGDLSECTEVDLLMCMNFVEGFSNGPFSAKFAQIFKAYTYRFHKNEFNQFLSKKYPSENIPHLSDSEFLDFFGDPPWDFVNEIFKSAGFPYSVLIPEITHTDTPYTFKLVNVNDSVEIGVDDLSSGEKIIMSLALTIYNSSIGKANFDLILLDEPDAALHPEFSKILLDVLKNVLVKKCGIKVIMTTHSPSTVAVSPEGSVFQLDRATKCLVPITNTAAVKILAEGLDYLKVSYENRRHVFVEHNHDAEYFERIYGVLKRKYKFSYTPIFLAPHNREGSNCSDVIEIVNKFRGGAYDLAFGIIDFDLKNVSNSPLFVLGGGRRYSIENYILDPIFVIIALVLERKNKFSDFGLERIEYCSELNELEPGDLQILIDNFMLKIGIELVDLKRSTLCCETTVQYPSEFLKYDGHAYSNKIFETFAGMQAIAKGKGEHGLKLGVLNAIESYPKFISYDLVETFHLVLGGGGGETA